MSTQVPGPYPAGLWTAFFKPENRGSCFAGVIFLFFAYLMPTIIFGALYDNASQGAVRRSSPAPWQDPLCRSYTSSARSPLLTVRAALQFGVIESIVSHALGNVIFGLLSPQPFCILGTTGPEIAYAMAFMNICNTWGLEYHTARVWQVLLPCE